MLLAGVWLGGHPQLLPGRVADALVDREGRVVAEASEYERFREATRGRFQGIGVTVRGVEPGLQVQRVVPGSPAGR